MRHSLHVSAYGGLDRVERIEAILAPAFQSVPKTESGRVDQRGLRYLLQLYFAQEHGWQLTGLEPHGFLEELSEIHDVAIIKEQAPSMARRIYDAARSARGVSLHDVASLAATLERLVLDQSVELLQVSYKANKLKVEDSLTESQLHAVLSTHLILFELTPQVLDTWPPTASGSFVDIARAQGVGMDHILDFEGDMVRNAAYQRRLEQNPFLAKRFTFEDVADHVDTLISNYGRWQNEECAVMSDHLRGRAHNGLVPLQSFFSDEFREMGFDFPESLDYFAEAGILDPSTKSIRLANYLSGPSNCIPASPYLSICCLSECNNIMRQITGHIQGPQAAPELLADVVANVSSRYVEAPRSMSASLRSRLQDIADRQGSEVQLHSRSFAIWLSEAFPDECPYPHIVKDKKHLAATYWKDALTESLAQQTERAERVQHLIEGGDLAEVDGVRPAQMSARDDQEVLYLAQPPAAPAGSARWLLHWLPAAALLLAAARLAVGAARAAWTAAAVAAPKAAQTSSWRCGGEDFGATSGLHV